MTDDKTIPDDKLKELLALEAKATPGPWHEQSLADGIRHLSKNWEPYGEECPDDYDLPRRRGIEGGMPDSSFICSARTSLRPLVEEVLRLRKALHRVVAVGHDDDCMFCGFKDRFALGKDGAQ